MKLIRFVIALIVAVVLVWGFNVKLGDLPPVGKFFSPFTGFWQNNEVKNFPSSELKLPGLKDKVIVMMDDNLVPHIFANNNHDLYFAQGYITAKYRLWQMEFQTAAAAGRVSEFIGAKAIEYDRQQRRFGMVYGAENALKEMMKDAECKEAVDAYTEGVNAWINALSAKNFPVEYKLLDYQPEQWTPLKCALLLKFMTYDLAGRSDDFYVTNILKKYGEGVIDSLFNGRPFIMDPIIPQGTPWDFSPLPVPPTPQSLIADDPALPFDHQPNPLNGSNNWAVGGAKSATGFPILCGDPHLGLNLPSLWFQIQLVSPDCNVCGVSLPGTPAVIIGFNRKIAWSETNVDADVLDWYSVKFKDASCNEYFFNNEWKSAAKRIEVIKVRGERDEIDTIVFTNHGPVVAMANQKPFHEFIPRGFAMRWLGHDPSTEMKTFLLLNRAQNYDEYVNALSYFSCPAQNFVYADADNNIAIWVNGKFPLKWKEQGKFLMEGTKPEYDWQSWIPHNEDPHVKNPQQGFVSSANQTPADSTYPYYLNWRFETFTRSHRINERLTQMNHITADSMRLLQFDEKNLTASTVLPSMLALLDQSKLDDRQKKIATVLQDWNDIAGAENIEQTIFSRWWNLLQAAIWDDEFGKEGMMYPEPDVTMRTIVNNINQSWVDNKNTPVVETLQGLVNQTFISALDSLSNQNGPDYHQWTWAKIKDTHINHLLRIPSLSRTFVNTGGNAGIVNASGADHGPSWRMIVELGKDPHAYGIYPGGQSGNPGSVFYDNMIDRWGEGRQNELVFLHSAGEKNSHIVSTTTLNH
ncbi:MAG TPA: penicillin acylase family protein [Chitinophagales bacterium]|nr:penicillin acylase family protein [Chitinophagales bacterium]